MSDVLIINKPSGMTSHDVVDGIRKITGIRRVGHAGTLDPLAEGVLVILIGREATKKQSEYMSGVKEYLATICLGATSPTDDAEGEVVKTANLSAENPTDTNIKKVLANFIGEISQIPPAYSAIQVGGERAYTAARQGRPLALKPRTVTVQNINLMTYEWPTLTLRITCSKGTYIRSLARDIGEALSCGAYLKHLVRTRSGNFSIDKAVILSSLTSDSWRHYLVKTTIRP